MASKKSSQKIFTEKEDSNPEVENVEPKPSKLYKFNSLDSETKDILEMEAEKQRKYDENMITGFNKLPIYKKRSFEGKVK